ncbi:NUDIX hydrolase [Streptomyces radicis]|uniref:NUDIX domain-containing protein n=1 Tax=Streptomyces radicis TaxID=1750517 RepID=A0A3A9VVC0_9ACTN|nr:NUDIX hydrolase [Streptomyces radicis]RKN04945.1 NUDIX domain-containing protein [Streptomyces radicis]RKN16352.1 NUDIX domain-containing protein [Streptomyces radicis]
MTALRLRVAAYAVCRDRDRVLLTRFVSRDRTQRHWSLPGGGVEHGEDPLDAVVREIAEETGHTSEVERLLGVDSRTRDDLHSIGVFYRARVTGGTLRPEVDGSSDLAAWHPIAEVHALPRAALVDIGLRLDRERPLAGHVPPIRVDGLLRH